MEIYLARHGTTAWNATHKIQGRSDTELDALGLEMARQSGMKFISQGITFDKVFSSPLKRALETARLLASSDEIITDPRLMELCFGTFEGQIVEEMNSSPDCFFRYFKSSPETYDRMVKESSDPSFESLTDLIARGRSFLVDQIEPLADKDIRVLISGHGAMNRALLMYMMSEDDLSRFWGTGLQSNCGITKISCSIRSGSVRYDLQDMCSIYYDPSLLDQISSLL